MKKQLTAILTAIFSVFICVGCGSTSTPPVTYTQLEGKEEYELTAINDKTATQFTIPATYKGLPVTSIGNYAFRDFTNLTSVTIPNSITNIGGYAFLNCEKLSNIKIPDSVVNISQYAFQNCKGFTNVTVPDSVQTMGTGIFNGCSSLTDITLPFAGDTIDDTYYPLGYVFGKDSYDGGEETVQLLGDYYNTTITYHIPNNLTNVVINSGEISKGEFAGCKNLTYIQIPSNATSIGEFAFSHCTSLTTIIIPDNVISIKKSAFRNCQNLTQVQIGSNVTELGEGVFSGCTRLASIRIPSKVESIGRYAFESCSNLQSVYFDDTTTWSRWWFFVDVGNPSTNAQYLTDDYVSDIWTKE